MIIARHGRTDANRAGLLLGRLDVDLDDVGRRQADALAAAVGPVDRVIASPLRRTMATAAAFGVDVDPDARWLELDYGDWDGTPVTDLPAETWATWRSDPDFTPPGGESLAALGARVADALDHLAVEAVDHTVVVVTHVSPIKAALAWTLGVSHDVAWRTYVAPASITRVALSDRGPSLHGFNDTGHLPT